MGADTAEVTKFMTQFGGDIVNSHDHVQCMTDYIQGRRFSYAPWTNRLLIARLVLGERDEERVVLLPALNHREN